MWNKKVSLTIAEEFIQEVIVAFLNNPHTVIDVNPDDMSYMLLDDYNSYYFAIDNEGIKLRNHEFFVDKRLELNKIDILKGIIKAETVKRRVAKKEQIFQNEIDLLTRIKNRLNEHTTERS